MSIGLSFEAQIQDVSEAREEVMDLAEQWNIAAFPDENSVSLSFCPIGILELQFEQDEANHWIMSGECVTTPAGPGLHKAVADFIETLADRLDLEILFDDEAEYMDYHDFKKMAEDHFYPWLETLMTIPIHQLEEEEYTSLCLCWDLNEYMPREIPGTIITHMGRFSITALAEKLEDGIEAFADQFFLWKNPIKDALYYRNCALNELWEHCYFAPSSRSELDRQINGFIFSHLEQALMMDRTLPFPIEAYYKLCQLDGKDPLDLTGVPELRYETKIGYRRDQITQDFGNVKFIFPGKYKYEYKQTEQGRGINLWTDESDPLCPLWQITGFSRNQGDAVFFEQGFEKVRDIEEFQAGEGICRYGWYSSNDELQLAAQIICGAQLTLITVTLQDEEQRDSVLELLHGVRALLPKEEVRQQATYSSRQ